MYLFEENDKIFHLLKKGALVGVKKANATSSCSLTKNKSSSGVPPPPSSSHSSSSTISALAASSSTTSALVGVKGKVRNPAVTNNPPKRIKAYVKPFIV